jgi:hypothetical protein
VRIEERPNPPIPAETSRPAHNASPPGRFRALTGGRTPLDGPEAARHLARAWRETFGKDPSPRALGILWAQWALETGRGRSMHGNNFGGLKGVGPEGGSAVLATREGFGSTETRIRSRFRAYETPEAGARDYVQTLADRYPEALAAAAKGDADGFVRGLEQRRYFTADPAEYRRGIGALLREYETRGPAGCRPLSIETPGPALDLLLWTLARATAKKAG